MLQGTTCLFAFCYSVHSASQSTSAPPPSPPPQSTLGWQSVAVVLMMLASQVLATARRRSIVFTKQLTKVVKTYSTIIAGWRNESLSSLLLLIRLSHLSTDCSLHFFMISASHHRAVLNRFLFPPLSLPSCLLPWTIMVQHPGMG